MSTLSTLRRLPAPCSEPPYDDEGSELAPATRSAGSPVQGTLALAFVLPSGLSAVPETPRPLRLVASPTPTASPAAPTAAAERSPLSGPDLPDPRWWASRLAQALVEVLAGDRPVAQLLRWTDEDVFSQLRRRARLAKPSDRTGHGPNHRALVRSVHIGEPCTGVVEACAVVRSGIRSRALAFRLEDYDGRWRCTALEIG